MAYNSRGERVAFQSRDQLRVLFLCTGNSARSQMAEGLLRFVGKDEFAVFSAGSDPQGLNPLTVQMMAEIGIDISLRRSKHLNEYLDQLTFNSVHGRWGHEARGEGDTLVVDETTIRYTRAAEPGAAPWRERGVDIVLECSGKFRTPETLASYFQQGVRKVIVAAPVKQGALNVVVGVNDHLYEPDTHHLLTASSGTTNCLAPVVKVIHEGIGIRHGMITTIHATRSARWSRSTTRTTRARRSSTRRPRW